MCGTALLLLLAWFSALMLRITLQYWPVHDDVAFLRIKQDYLGLPWWKAAFFRPRLYQHVRVGRWLRTQFAPRRAATLARCASLGRKSVRPERVPSDGSGGVGDGVLR